jgi:hypothetical protein
MAGVRCAYCQHCQHLFCIRPSVSQICAAVLSCSHLGAPILVRMLRCTAVLCCSVPPGTALSQMYPSTWRARRHCWTGPCCVWGSQVSGATHVGVLYDVVCGDQESHVCESLGVWTGPCCVWGSQVSGDTQYDMLHSVYLACMPSAPCVSARLAYAGFNSVLSLSTHVGHHAASSGAIRSHMFASLSAY